MSTFINQGFSSCDNNMSNISFKVEEDEDINTVVTLQFVIKKTSDPNVDFTKSGEISSRTFAFTINDYEPLNDNPKSLILKIIRELNKLSLNEKLDVEFSVYDEYNISHNNKFCLILFTPNNNIFFSLGWFPKVLYKEPEPRFSWFSNCFTFYTSIKLYFKRKLYSLFGKK